MIVTGWSKSKLKQASIFNDYFASASWEGIEWRAEGKKQEF